MLIQSLLFFSILTSARAATIRARQYANATASAAPNVVFDGRVRANATVTDFDGTAGPFNPDFVKGENISFSQLIKFPDGETALFDSSVGAKAFEVTISDQSIFNPGGSNAQTAVRRAELMPRGDLVADNLTTTGIKTLHFSIKPSADRPLNVSHEYLMVFLERADFAGNLFMLRTGTLIGSDGSTKDDLVLFGNTQNGTQTLFTTPFEKTAFTNFALRLDFTQNTIQVFQSTGGAPLVQQTAPLPNDLSGNGDYHFGLNKNPTDPGADSLRSGFQESGINEGMVYGGIFIEDNANSTVTLS